MENKVYDLLGIGVGPFNLSLAALLDPVGKIDAKFLDAKSEFSWHPELMFDEATMQTSFLKDLVTPVDPTNPYSFLNYLANKGQFYHFLNTSRNAITRMEFEDYLKWCSKKLDKTLEFNSKVTNVEFLGDKFKVTKTDGEYFAKNLCVASGPIQNIPECAKGLLGNKVFHAKSKEMMNLSLEGKKVLIVGGGQTGVETFRNALKSKWGSVESLTMITGRENLLPLDEGPFTNEIFTPDFVSNFHSLPQENKDSFTKSLLLASDGNTPSYLQELYNELYMDKFYNKKFSPYTISPMRWLENLSAVENSYCALVKNRLNEEVEEHQVDIVILATGFCTDLPEFLNGISDKIKRDSQGRLIIQRDYKLEAEFGDNQIFAMNYSRHGHGVADPQTSLMSWRSSVIANSLLGYEHYRSELPDTSFLNYFSQGN